MHNTKANATAYIQQYPGLAKWIHTCGRCGFQGYRPELPDNFPGFSVAASHIRSYFPELVLDADGLCEQCHENTR